VSAFSATHRAHAAKCLPSGPQNATIIVPDNVSVQLPRSERDFWPDSVAVFSSEGACVGAAAWKEQAFAFSIAGRDPITARGLQPGRLLRFKVYDASEQSARMAQVSYVPCQAFNPGIRSLCRPDGHFQPNVVFIVKTVSVSSQRYLPEQGPSVSKGGKEGLQIQVRKKLGSVRFRWSADEAPPGTHFQIQRQVVRDTSVQFATDSVWEAVRSVTAASETDLRDPSYRFTDEMPFNAERIIYRIRQISPDGFRLRSKEVVVNRRPTNRLTLHPPFPNPARAQATIRYELPTDMDVHLDIYDLLGRRVVAAVHGAERAGRKEIQLDVSQLASGTYVCRLSAEHAVHTQTMQVVH